MEEKKEEITEVKGKRKFKKVGALWKKTYMDKKEGKRNKMISGQIDLGILGAVNIMIFKNDNKTSEKGPDYQIYMPLEDYKKEDDLKEEAEDDDV